MPDEPAEKPVEEVAPDAVIVHPRQVKLAEKNDSKVDKNRAKAAEYLAAVEDDMYETSSKVIADFLAFREVNPRAGDKELDAVVRRWAETIGTEEAERRMRLALTAWNPVSDMPAGVKVASEQFAAITKARAKAPEVTLELKAEFESVSLSVAPEYPELVEESE